MSLCQTEVGRQAARKIGQAVNRPWLPDLRYRQIVPGAWNTSRVIHLASDTPFTV